MTGLRSDQLAVLILAVSTLVGDWQPKKGRRKVLDLHRAVVLTLFLLRHDNVQDVAGDLSGCSQSTVSRVFRKVRPLLEQATAAVAAEAVQRARLGGVLLDGFVAPTGERADRTDLFSGKHRLAGMNVQVIADLDGRVVDTGTPIGGPGTTASRSPPAGSPNAGLLTSLTAGRACLPTRATRAAAHRRRTVNRPAGR